MNHGRSSPIPGLLAALIGIGMAIALSWIGILALRSDLILQNVNAPAVNAVANVNTPRNTNTAGNTNVANNANRSANTNATPQPNDDVSFPNGTVSASCSAIDDCILVDRTLDLRSCWPGACGVTDNASADVVSVNAQSYGSYRAREETYQPTDCGPPLGCPVGIAHPELQAECVAGRCAKISRPIEEAPPENR